MFPWLYETHTTAATVIFLLAFYSVLITILTTVGLAVLRSAKDLRAHRLTEVRWLSEFEELSEEDRICRHVFAGSRVSGSCQTGFECTSCGLHAKLQAHPQLRLSSPNQRILGMRYPGDRFYHRGHAWLRYESDGSVLVGLDEMGRRILNGADVTLPQPGAFVTVNGAVCCAREGASQARILCPVTGRVMRVGRAGDEWHLWITPGPDVDVGPLLSGAEVGPWILYEVRRLWIVLRAVRGVLPVNPRSGNPVPPLAPSDLDAVWSAIFLEP